MYIKIYVFVYMYKCNSSPFVGLSWTLKYLALRQTALQQPAQQETNRTSPKGIKRNQKPKRNSWQWNVTCVWKLEKCWNFEVYHKKINIPTKRLSQCAHVYVCVSVCVWVHVCERMYEAFIDWESQSQIGAAHISK